MTDQANGGGIGFRCENLVRVNPKGFAISWSCTLLRMTERQKSCGARTPLDKRHSVYGQAKEPSITPYRSAKRRDASEEFCFTAGRGYTLSSRPPTKDAESVNKPQSVKFHNASLREGPIKNDWQALKLGRADVHFAMHGHSQGQGDSLADKNNPGLQRNAAIQVLNIIVHKPNAPGRHEVSDGLGRVRSVNKKTWPVRNQRPGAKRISRTARHRTERRYVFCDAGA